MDRRFGKINANYNDFDLFIKNHQWHLWPQNWKHELFQRKRKKEFKKVVLPFLVVAIVAFLIGIHSKQGWAATTMYGLK